MTNEQQPADQGRDVGEMDARRAALFLQRFKNDEKMLGPNEQAALDFAIAALSQPKVEISDDVLADTLALQNQYNAIERSRSPWPTGADNPVENQPKAEQAVSGNLESLAAQLANEFSMMDIVAAFQKAAPGRIEAALSLPRQSEADAADACSHKTFLFIMELLVTAGYITQEIVDQAVDIAAGACTETFPAATPQPAQADTTPAAHGVGD